MTNANRHGGGLPGIARSHDIADPQANVRFSRKAGKLGSVASAAGFWLSAQ